MQYFGELQTKYEEVFLTRSYMYFNREDEEEITAKDLKQKIKTAKDRKKNIIGTVYMYNPIITPMGFDTTKFLLDQEFDAFDELSEVKDENYITAYKQAMKDTSVGKIVEIKNLFNLNEKHIDTPSLLDKFNSDLEKYMSAQNTEFDRDLMYLDAANFIPSGKFVLFSWGEKLNKKEFPSIYDYAQIVYDHTVKLGKNIVFVYKKEKTIEGSINLLQFPTPMHNVKYRTDIAFALKLAFKEFPPTTAFYL